MTDAWRGRQYLGQAGSDARLATPLCELQTGTEILALRYSEDIDLVQADPEPIGGTVGAIRADLSWLGKCSREQAGHSMRLVFKVTPKIDAQVTLKLKVKIDTREHANLLAVRRYLFAVENDWYCGTARIASFAPEELFATKLLALLQRRRNRDLFDLHEGLEQFPLALE